MQDDLYDVLNAGTEVGRAVAGLAARCKPCGHTAGDVLDRARGEAAAATREYVRRAGYEGEALPGTPLRFVTGRVSDRLDRLGGRFGKRLRVRYVEPKPESPLPPKPHPGDELPLYWRHVPLALKLAKRWTFPGWERSDFDQEALCLLREHAVRYCAEGRADEPLGYLSGRVRKGLWARLRRERLPRMFTGRKSYVGDYFDPPPGDGDDEGPRWYGPAKRGSEPRWHGRGGGESALAGLDRREDRELLLSPLTLQELAVVALRLWCDEGPTKIAGRLGMTADAVTSMLRRIFSGLRDGFESRPG